MAEEQDDKNIDSSHAERKVLGFIRDQIISGQLKAGARLPSERKLCDDLGVSRVYVRKALAKLDHYGLTETMPQKGTIVAEMGSKAITGLIASIGSLDEGFNPPDLFEIRALLETFAARKAAEVANQDDITEILKWHSEFRAKTSMGTRALDEDHLFHLAIARASRNAVCLSLISYITPQIISLNTDFPESDPQRFQRTFEEHDKIVQKIISKNPEGAYEAMKAHMDEAWKRRLPNKKT